MVNDGDAPEVSLNARDMFRISTFCVIIDNHKAEISGRAQVHSRPVFSWLMYQKHHPLRGEYSILIVVKN